MSLSLLGHLPRSYLSHTSAAGGVSPLPAMFELHPMPSLEHTDNENGVSLAVLLSWKRDAAFCELCPLLVVTPELLYG